MRDDSPHPLDPRLEALLRRVDPIHSVPETEPRTDLAWNGLAARMTTSIVAPRKTLFAHYYRGFSLIAVLFVSIGFWSHWRSSAFANRRSVTNQYATTRGQQATIVLPDGSHVVLGDATTLRFTGERSGARVVKLDGQALFTITPDNSRPFIVHTAHVTTRVLGTSFVVRKYATDDAARIAVASGKVSVYSIEKSRAQAQVVFANTTVQMSDSGQFTISPNASIGDELAWTRGRLVFHATPVMTVVADVERRYDIVIRFADSSFTGARLTASLDTETAAQALDLLAVALNARYSRSGNVVTFTPVRRVLHTAPSRLPFTSEYKYGR